MIIAEAIARLGFDVSQLEKSIPKVKAVGLNMTSAFTVPTLTAAAAAIKFGNDFNDQLDAIVGLVGVSRDQVNAWKDDLLDLSSATAQGPAKLAETLYFTTSSGIDLSHAMEVVEISAKSATAGLGEAAVIADALTSAMNAYGAENLSAARAADILVAAVREGKVEASALAPVMGRLLPTASALGIGFEQIAGQMAVMSRTGLDAAEASTSLNAILSTMLKPSDAARKLLASVGLSMDQIRDIASGPNGLLAVMMLLDKTFEGNDEALSAILPNVRAFRGFMNVLAQDSTTVQNVLNDVTDSTGALDHAFEEITSGPGFQFRQAINKIRVALTSLGDIAAPVIIGTLLPILREGIGVLEVLIDAFARLPAPVQSAIVVLTALLAVTGPLLVWAGMFIQLAPALFTAWSIAFGPVGATVGAVMALTAALYLMLAPTDLVPTAFLKMRLAVLDFVIDSIPYLEKFAKAIERYVLGPLGLALTGLEALGKTVGVDVDLSLSGNLGPDVMKYLEDQRDRTAYEIIKRNGGIFGGPLSIVERVQQMIKATKSVTGGGGGGPEPEVPPIITELEKAKTVLESLIEAYKIGTAETEKYVASLAREALQKSQAAASALFGRPTREMAQLELQRALLQKTALEVNAGPDSDIQQQIKQLDQQLSIMQADITLKQKELQLADQTLLTQAEVETNFRELVAITRETSQAVRDYAVMTGQSLIPEMNDLRQAVEDMRLGIRFLTDEEFRNSFFPAVEAAAAQVTTLGEEAASTAERLAVARNRLQEFMDSIPSGEDLYRVPQNSIQKHHSGTDYVTQTGIYELERGEKVIPAHESLADEYSERPIYLVVDGREIARVVTKHGPRDASEDAIVKGRGTR